MNISTRAKAGLQFGIGMSILFIIQHLLINDTQTTYHIVRAIITGLVSGAIAGVLFGWIAGWFAKSDFVAQTTKIEIDPGESIVFETPANHFKGIEGVGGKLYLTNKRLIFKSHTLNFQNHQLTIHLTDIRHIERYKTLGIINKGLAITTIHNSKEKFIVEEVETWVKLLTSEQRLTVN